GDLAEQAAAAHQGDLNGLLLDFTDRVGAERDGGGDDGGGVAVGAIVLVGASARGGGALLLSRRRRRAREAEGFEEARRNARDDLVALGDDIRALDLDVQMPDADPEVRSDYEHAVQRYTEADERWEVARRPTDLAPVAEALEEGRWAMASANARRAGEEPPERRPPCFFDPRHGPSTRDVLWSPPYGQPREVPACEADALRVEVGEDPEAREVVWGGQRVPYWQARPPYAPHAGGLFRRGAAAARAR